MKRQIKLPQTLALILMALPLLASAEQNPAYPEFGVATGEGSGCLNNDLSSTVSPDGTVLSVLFNSLSAQAGNGVRKVGKECRVHIPVAVPEGMELDHVDIDWRGYTLIPNHAYSRMVTFHKFIVQEGRGTWGRDVSTLGIINGPADQDFLYTEHFQAPDVIVQRSCGKDIFIVTNIVLDLQSNAAREDAILSLDSADSALHTRGELSYRLSWRPCKPGT